VSRQPISTFLFSYLFILVPLDFQLHPQLLDAAIDRNRDPLALVKTSYSAVQSWQRGFFSYSVVDDLSGPRVWLSAFLPPPDCGGGMAGRRGAVVTLRASLSSLPRAVLRTTTFKRTKKKADEEFAYIAISPGTHRSRGMSAMSCVANAALPSGSLGSRHRANRQSQPLSSNICSTLVWQPTDSTATMCDLG
jgi:hypothetical protein